MKQNTHYIERAGDTATTCGRDAAIRSTIVRGIGLVATCGTCTRGGKVKVERTEPVRPPQIEREVFEYSFTRRRIAEQSPSLATPEAMIEFVGPMLEGLEQEEVLVVLVDRKQQPLGVIRLYKLGLAGGQIRLAELYREAVRLSAHGVVIAHNHPSGIPTPSMDDVRTTRDAAAAGRLLGIQLVDHIIVGDDRHGSVSMRREGHLTK